MIRSLVCLTLLLFCTPPASAQSQDCEEAKSQVERLQSRLKDWPFLGRYRELNAKVSQPLKDERRVVFFGDSITDAWKLSDYFAGKPYVNRGIAGQTTPQMLIRFRPDVIALRPRVVVILAGTNDIAGNTGPTTPGAIQDNLASLVELARANNIRVVLASLLPVSDYHKSADGKALIQTARRPPEQIKALNEWIKRYATEHELTYLDYYAAMVDERGFLKEELSYDGLHPNKKGYDVMAPLAEHAISSALKGKTRKR
jgi:lysophospholipase L1-like esterase